MMMPPLEMLARSLVLTLIFEGIFGLIWGIKGRRDWLLLLLVNVVTNPIVVIHYYNHYDNGGIPLWIYVAMLEMAAVIAEWLAYRRWGGKSTRPAFLFALCANGFSFCIGLILNMI